MAQVSGIFATLRFVWSFAMDKYSFKQVYGMVLLIQICIGALLPTILDLSNENLQAVLFTASVWIIFMVEGAHFTIAPTIFAKLFGSEGGIRVFSVGFSFAGVSSLT